MDHILEHEGQPVPDMQAVAESAASGPMDVDDDDEDAVAAANLAGLEAKVRFRVR